MKIPRRDFIAFLGGAAAAPMLAPRAARAQQGGMKRVGVLVSLAEDDPEIQASLTGFRQGLERLGWSEGGNVRFDVRFAQGDYDKITVLAKELVALQPDAIFAHSTPVTVALQRETRTIPIVFVNASDPLGSGFVASLARPGGNLTGLLLYEEGITGKWLAMLKEIAPGLTRAAFVSNPKITTHDYYLSAAKAAAASLAIEIVPSLVETEADIGREIESFAREPNGGLLVTPNYTTLAHRDLVIALAARYRLPAVYAYRVFVADGGLMSYGIDQVAMWRQAASHVDRILRGSKPADLPVQAPTKYVTTLNLKTAKALGLDVPPSLLVRADEVIE
jgi:putative ABC transport system substrate-binding protein